jgi:hypothetical protein
MTRLRSLAIAGVGLVLSATAVAAFTDLPDAASNGLEKALDASRKSTVPARPADPPGHTARSGDVTVAADLPDAASHGADVSGVATGDDPTPETNRGADVSEAARDNHGQDVAADNRPADAGRPADVGAPDGAGKPDGAGQPEDPGPPADPGPPDGAGKPDGVPPRP